jgi:hypothetical protein
MDAQTQSREPRRGLTFEDVWAALMESRDRFEREKLEYDERSERNSQELRQMAMKMEQAVEETAKAIKETDKAIKETGKAIKETDKAIKETSKAMKETDKAMKDTDKRMKETDKRMGYLSNRFGELAEHMVAPSIADKFNALGYHFDATSEIRELRDEKGRVVAEIDILLENGEYSVAVEVKAKPKVSDIDGHIKRIEILRRHKDRHNDKRAIRGAIAGAIFPPSVKDAALKTGFYVIEQSGDSVKINIPEDFKPTEW